MKALVCKQFGSFNDLVIEERDPPVAAEGQLVVEVHAAGLNFPDLLTIAGRYQVRTEPPFVPGVEGAGIVKAVGPGGESASVGDRVMFTSVLGGAFAQQCAVESTHVMPLPQFMNFEQGAGFAITYATSYHAFKQCAPVQSGQTVLVLGAAGGVGTTAVEIASAMGARVIAAASSVEKTEFASQAGANETINYSDRSLKESVLELTDGKGVDVVYDPVGGNMARQALSALAWGGRYLVVGFASGEIPAFPANLLLLKEASVIGVYWGDWAALNPRDAASNFHEVAELVRQGSLNPRTTAVYPLDRFKEAFSEIAERRALGKVVLTSFQD